MSEIEYTDVAYEQGKALFFQEDANMEDYARGWQFLNDSHKSGNPEATFLIGYAGYRRTCPLELCITGDRKESITLTPEIGWDLICEAAAAGSVRAKHFLDQEYEKERKPDISEETVLTKETAKATGPLTDFDGTPIHIRREGLLTPVDAVLKYENGENILDFSLNLKFHYFDEIGDVQEDFEEAVIEGIQAWGGEYQVFGGQSVKVRFTITQEDRAFDNIFILPVTESMEEIIQDSMKMTLSKRKRHLLENSLAGALYLFRWSARGRKAVIIRAVTGSFGHRETIKNLMRHEFGHVLGLGDLYRDRRQKYDGVAEGKYYDLDPYYISEGRYNLIMCQKEGKISNNDMEMVILAFSENRMQLYQANHRGGVISRALGRGD